MKIKHLAVLSLMGLIFWGNAWGNSKTVIINQPSGGQTVCIINGNIITCY